jgi:hypothetical protein
VEVGSEEALKVLTSHSLLTTYFLRVPSVYNFN